MMRRLTNLKSPLTRRIGSLVVRISADGIDLRGYRRRQWQRVTWARVASLLHDDPERYFAKLEQEQGQKELAKMGVYRIAEAAR